NVYISGDFTGTLDFDPSPAGTFNINAQFTDVFVIELAQVAPPNQSPVVTASVGNTAFTEGTAVIIDNGLMVTDANNTNLASATVAITANFQSGQDALLFTNQNGITGNYNAATGVLSLSGSASVINYQTALRSVRYNNTSSNPNTVNRTISVQVNDGIASSNTAIKTITITEVNNLSAVTTTGGTTSHSAGTPVL